MNKYANALVNLCAELKDTDSPYIYYKQYNKDIQLLADLIDRATPKKPALVRRTFSRSGDVYECPTCKRVFTGNKHTNYCYRCGQALKRDEEEEE